MVEARRDTTVTLEILPSLLCCSTVGNTTSNVTDTPDGNTKALRQDASVPVRFVELIGLMNPASILPEDDDARPAMRGDTNEVVMHSIGATC